jgi:glyoxylase-like metal-dependent hydrolase (beta-lactamase superfamily II)
MVKVQIIKVAEKIWCIRRRDYLTCSYIVETPKGIVCVDAGMDSSGKDIEEGLSEIGRNVKNVCAILLTHWHNDHAAGACAIQKKSGASVYYHSKESAFLSAKNTNTSFASYLSDMIPEWSVLVLAKGLLKESVAVGVSATDYVSKGNIVCDDFVVIETPGHTSGHLSYYYRPKKVLFAGDALAVIGNKIRFMSRPVTPDLVLARSSMIRSLSFDIDILCPGHRIPLTNSVSIRCKEMLDYLTSGKKWPLFG